jgi:hypothetical protein
MHSGSSRSVLKIDLGQVWVKTGAKPIHLAATRAAAAAAAVITSPQHHTNAAVVDEKKNNVDRNATELSHQKPQQQPEHEQAEVSNEDNMIETDTTDTLTNAKQRSSLLSKTKRISPRRKSLFKSKCSDIKNTNSAEKFIAGYLQKRTSGPVKRWQTRYFEVVGKYLQYRNAQAGLVSTKKSKRDDEGDRIQGQIDVTNATGVSISKENQILIKIEDNHPVLLMAKTRSEAQAWVMALEKAIAAAQSPSSASPLASAPEHTSVATKTPQHKQEPEQAQEQEQPLDQVAQDTDDAIDDDERRFWGCGGGVGSSDIPEKVHLSQGAWALCLSSLQLELFQMENKDWVSVEASMTKKAVLLEPFDLDVTLEIDPQQKTGESLVEAPLAPKLKTIKLGRRPNLCFTCYCSSLAVSVSPSDLASVLFLERSARQSLQSFRHFRREGARSKLHRRVASTGIKGQSGGFIMHSRNHGRNAILEAAREMEENEIYQEQVMAAQLYSTNSHFHLMSSAVDVEDLLSNRAAGSNISDASERTGASGSRTEITDQLRDAINLQLEGIEVALCEDIANDSSDESDRCNGTSRSEAVVCRFTHARIRSSRAHGEVKLEASMSSVQVEDRRTDSNSTEKNTSRYRLLLSSDPVYQQEGHDDCASVGIGGDCEHTNIKQLVRLEFCGQTGKDLSGCTQSSKSQQPDLISVKFNFHTLYLGVHAGVFTLLHPFVRVYHEHNHAKGQAVVKGWDSSVSRHAFGLHELSKMQCNHVENFVENSSNLKKTFGGFGDSLDFAETSLDDASTTLRKSERMLSRHRRGASLKGFSRFNSAVGSISGRIGGKIGVINSITLGRTGQRIKNSDGQSCTKSSSPE